MGKERKKEIGKIKMRAIIIWQKEKIRKQKKQKNQKKQNKTKQIKTKRNK